MTEHETVALFKCLADTMRLQILKTLAEGPMYAELLAQRLDRAPSTISFHMKKLEEAGLVQAEKEQYYTVYTLREELLSLHLRDLLAGQSDQQQDQEERERLYRQKVLDSFFQDGRLRSIPVQRKKERIILENLVERFQPGQHYTEREVNLILSEVNDDFCTLRRDMVGEKLMERENGIYWRTEEEK